MMAPISQPAKILDPTNLWRKIAASLLLLLVIGLLIAPHSLEALPSGESDARGDAAHFPAFISITLLIFSLLSPNWSLLLRITLCAVISCSLAFATEFIQSYTPGRMASWHDLLANLLGVIAASSAIWVWKNTSLPLLCWKKIIHATLTIAIATLLALPYFKQVHARHYCQQQFPVLSDFHDPAFALLWKAQNGSSSKLSLSSIPPRLVVTLPADKYFTGINYLPSSQNWSPYSSLHLTLHNPGTTFTLGIRIDDDSDCSQLNSRFNNQFPLKPGSNHISYDLKIIRQSPQNRELNLNAIRRLLLFTQQNHQNQKFSILHISLK